MDERELHAAPIGRREGWFFAAMALIVLLLQVLAIERQSLIGDAPYHLLAGEQALRTGSNVINLEHPPLVKLVAALPLLGLPAQAETTSVDGVIEASLELFEDPERAQQARRRARAALLLAFGLPLLIASFFLGRRLGGPRTGAVLALTLGLSFPILPHFAVVQTDTAVALGFTLSVLTLLAWRERPDAKRSLAVGVALGLALATKFSAVLLVPVVVAAMLTATGLGPQRKIRDLFLVAVAALLCLEATYVLANLQYDPELGRDAISRYCRGEALITGDALRSWEEPLLALERVDPRMAQYFTGLLGIRAQNDLGVYPTYAFGEIASEGRWWFFPALLLTLLPLPILALSLLALRNLSVRRYMLPAATAAFYFLIALTSSYNLGIRHLLPILPLLYLPAAGYAGRRPQRAIALVLFLAVEAVALTPQWMSATNTWWLGSMNPTRTAFSTGQSEYRQNFLLLATELERRDIEQVAVLYPLLDQRELRAWIPQARLLRPGDPLPSGWYAVHLVAEQYLTAIEDANPEDLRGFSALEALAESWQPLYRKVVAGENHGPIAGTFHLYRLETGSPTINSRE